MCKCDTCIHAAFDELWGEVKCKKEMIVVYYPEDKTECENYEKRKKKEVRTNGR